MILPSFGVISEVVSSFSHNPPLSYRLLVYSTFGISFVGFLTWGHHMFVSGMSTFDAGLFGILSMFVAIFSAIKVFTWTMTLRGGSIRLATPLLYFFGFMFLFVFGGMTGVAVASESLDVHWHDTYFVVAHFHFIMVGGSLTGFLAALHYWFPKITGRSYSERWGLLCSALVISGFFFTFMPQFLLGNAGMPRRYYSYPPEYQWLNVLSTGGASILALGLIITVIYLTAACFRGERVGPNPWGSRSFEWRVPSPPPQHNFVEPPDFDQGAYAYGSGET
jgi:cytochrome c oxidase subunit 1